jgi:hypothetical protein|tara:strand:- start:8092 stop:8376 length:285 start_codon:yes stop_codon:yes gene_type:complete
MKTVIKIRRVYYKYAEIEIDVPSTLHDDFDSVHDYLLEKETEWGYKLEKALDEAEFEHGNGMDSDDGWTDETSEQEVRYEVDPEGDSYLIGGHI